MAKEKDHDDGDPPKRKRGKRGANEGSIYKRANGTWCAQVTVPPEGKRLTKYAKTRRECQEWIAETLSKINEGFDFDGSRSTLAEYLTYWLSVVKASLRPKTWRQYEQIARQHITPFIGPVKLHDLRPDHIQKLYSERLAAGIGARTVQLIHAVLHRSLEQALKWNLMPRNPSSAVEKPRFKRTEMKFLDREQARHFLEVAQGNRYHALFHLAITTGMRQGELLGLRWADIDLDKNQLHVQRQLQFVPGDGLHFVEPKTDSSRRLIQLSEVDVRVLRSHRKKQVEERLACAKWQDGDLVFPSRVGTPTSQRNMYRDFKRILKEADLPDIRFHDLRHTAATLMLQAGIGPDVVKKRLGHSSITLTLDTYSHVMPSMQDDAAKAMSKVLGYCNDTATAK